MLITVTLMIINIAPIHCPIVNVSCRNTTPAIIDITVIRFANRDASDTVTLTVP